MNRAYHFSNIETQGFCCRVRCANISLSSRVSRHDISKMVMDGFKKFGMLTDSQGSYNSAKFNGIGVDPASMTSDELVTAIGLVPRFGSNGPSKSLFS